MHTIHLISSSALRHIVMRTTFVLRAQTSSDSIDSESKHSYLRQKIATILVSSDDRDLLYLPAFNGIIDDRNYDINCGSDGPLLGCLCCFAHQIFQANQRLRGAVCMDRRNASGMARVPGLQQRQSCHPISDFADDDPVWFKPQRNLEALELVKLRCRQHAQTVGRVEQKFLCIFDHQHPIAGCEATDLFEDGIRNSRLPSARSTDNEHI